MTEQLQIALPADLEYCEDRDYGETSLISACRDGHAEIVRLLLGAGANKNAKTCWGTTALSMAISGSHLDTVKILLDAEVYKEMTCIMGNWSPLMLAVTKSVPFVELLLKAGADINAPNQDGNTALMKACEWNRVEAAKLLIDAGAAINARNAKGQTPLMRASEMGSMAIVKQLLDAGADHSVFDNEGRNAVDLAKTESVKKILLIYGASDGPIALLRTVSETISGTQVFWARKRTYYLEDWLALQAKYVDAVGVEDFALVASLGCKNLRIQREVADLPLSEENYRTLPARHAAIVERVLKKCQELTATEQFDFLKILAGALDKLRARDTVETINKISETILKLATVWPAEPTTSTNGAGVSSTDCIEISAVCDQLTVQAALLPQRRDLIQRQAATQLQFDAAVAAANFSAVAALGLARKALLAESAQLPLSEEDYLTLPARHAAQVQRVTDQCRQLVRANNFAALTALSKKLSALKTLDVGILDIPEKSHNGSAGDNGLNDPMVVSDVEEDAGENDPVIISYSA